MAQGIVDNPLDLNEPVDPNDRFAYGWRYVKQAQPDGTEKLVQVPLALEDILHPQEEDFRVLSDPHNEDCRYLKSVFKARLADDPHALVLSDCRVSWDPTGRVGYGPDLAVFRSVREPNRYWITFNVVNEGAGPLLIVEVTSPETRSTDLADKVQLYHEHGVPVYVIADRGRRPGQSPFRLLGFRHAPDAYEELVPDARGWLWLEAVGLWLGIEGNRVVCYEADGKRVPDYMELAQALADRDAQVRESREETRQAADMLRRAETLHQQARAIVDAADTKYEAFQAKLAAEVAARAALEERLKQLEAELRRQRGESDPPKE